LHTTKSIFLMWSSRYVQLTCDPGDVHRTLNSRLVQSIVCVALPRLWDRGIVTVSIVARSCLCPGWTVSGQNMECLPLVSSLSSSPSGPAATTSCLYPPHFPVIAVAMGIVTHMPAMQPYAHTRCDLQPSSCAPMFNRETFHTATGMICMLCALLAADKKALVIR
jgi:hypothetical protein